MLRPTPPRAAPPGVPAVAPGRSSSAMGRAYVRMRQDSRHFAGSHNCQRSSSESPHHSRMSEPRIHTHRSTWGAFLIGVAVMAAVDEIVFHQILGWHHFYDGATLEIGLLTDGLLHAFELFALVAGFFLLAHEWRGGTFN